MMTREESEIVERALSVLVNAETRISDDGEVVSIVAGISVSNTVSFSMTEAKLYPTIDLMALSETRARRMVVEWMMSQIEAKEG